MSTFRRNVAVFDDNGVSVAVSSVFLVENHFLRQNAFRVKVRQTLIINLIRYIYGSCLPTDFSLFITDLKILQELNPQQKSKKPRNSPPLFSTDCIIIYLKASGLICRALACIADLNHNNFKIFTFLYKIIYEWEFLCHQIKILLFYRSLHCNICVWKTSFKSTLKAIFFL